MHRAWTNLLLMIVICIAIFIIFIALRPAVAGNITDWKCGKSVLEVAAHKEFKNSPFGGPVALLRRRDS